MKQEKHTQEYFDYRSQLMRKMDRDKLVLLERDHSGHLQVHEPTS